MDKKGLLGATLATVVVSASIVSGLWFAGGYEVCGIEANNVSFSNGQITKDGITKLAQTIEKRAVDKEENVVLGCKAKQIVEKRLGKDYISIKVSEQGCRDITTTDYITHRKQVIDKIKSGDYDKADFKEFVEIFNYESARKCVKK